MGGDNLNQVIQKMKFLVHFTTANIIDESLPQNGFGKFIINAVSKEEGAMQANARLADLDSRLGTDYVSKREIRLSDGMWYHFGAHPNGDPDFGAPRSKPELEAKQGNSTYEI